LLEIFTNMNLPTFSKHVFGFFSITYQFYLTGTTLPLNRINHRTSNTMRKKQNTFLQDQQFRSGTPLLSSLKTIIITRTVTSAKFTDRTKSVVERD